MMKGKNALKLTGFIAALLWSLFLVSKLLSPTWLSWNNDDTMKEFYEEPDDTIQVLFLGTSQVVNGISGNELYNRYGLCTYSLASEQQPFLSSYYWILEAYKHHKKTLSTIVLDISFLMYADEAEYPLQSCNEKALAHMKLSPIKAEALKACSEQYESFDVLENMFPLLRYHTRWKDLNRDDFKGLINAENILYTRGYNVDYSRASSVSEADKIIQPRWDLTDAINSTSIDYESIWSQENIHWFRKIVSFCKVNNLHLVLTKLPKTWDDRLHDGVQYLAQRYSLPFIDFNDGYLQESIGFFIPLDLRDTTHPNIYGARKISNYIGKFLTEHYTYTDVRTDPAYDYMKEQYRQYYKMYEDSWLQNTNSLTGYCSQLDRDRYSIFVATNGEAARHLTDAEREAMADLGFTEFADLSYDRAYAGVRSGGAVVVDLESDSFRDRLLVDGWIDDKDGVSVATAVSQKLNSKSEVVLAEDEEKPYEKKNGFGFFSIYCGSRSAGRFASIILNGKEYSENHNGINFVVYNNETRTVVDTSSFQPGEHGARRTSDTAPIAEYKKLVLKNKKKAEGIS